jgi:hypothetical protein
MDAELFTKLAQGGFAAGLLFLLYLVGMRLVRAVDKLVTKLDEHTTADLQHHGYVRDELIAVSTRVEMLFEHTPVEQPEPKRRTAPRGIPAGQYGFTRPRTKAEDE